LRLGFFVVSDFLEDIFVIFILLEGLSLAIRVQESVRLNTFLTRNGVLFIFWVFVEKLHRIESFSRFLQDFPFQFFDFSRPRSLFKVQSFLDFFL